MAEFVLNFFNDWPNVQIKDDPGWGKTCKGIIWGLPVLVGSAKLGREMTKKQVKEAIGQVMDPELGVSIVDLGLIYDIEIKKQKNEMVKVVMTLTTPGCPLAGWMVSQVKEAVVKDLGLGEEQIVVEVTFDPPWSQELMSEKAKEQLGWL